MSRHLAEMHHSHADLWAGRAGVLARSAQACDDEADLYADERLAEKARQLATATATASASCMTVAEAYRDLAAAMEQLGAEGGDE